MIDENDKVKYEDFTPIEPVEDGERHYTNPTIRLGVLPDTLTSSIARDSSLEIRAYPNSLKIQNVDIAYREQI